MNIKQKTQIPMVKEEKINKKIQHLPKTRERDLHKLRL